MTFKNNETKVYAKGFPVEASDSDLNQYFSNFGTVLRVDLKKDDNGVSKGFAFVTFDTKEAVDLVVNYDSHDIAGHKITVSQAHEPMHAKMKGQGKGQDMWGGNDWNMGMMGPMAMMGMGGMGGMMGWGGGKSGKGGKGKGGDAAPGHAPNPKKVFLGGLSTAVTKTQIAEWAANYGDVASIDFKTTPDGKCRKFSFVTFTNLASAQAALANHDSNSIGGQWMEVKSCGPDGKAEAATSVFAGGLPWEIDEEKLTTYFSQFGTLEKVDLKMNKDTGRCKGYAFIHFTDGETAEACIAHTPHTLGGRTIDVKVAGHNLGQSGNQGSGKGGKKGGKKGGNMMNMATMMGGMGGGMGMGGMGMGGMGGGMGGMGMGGGMGGMGMGGMGGMGMGGMGGMGMGGMGMGGMGMMNKMGGMGMMNKMGGMGMMNKMGMGKGMRSRPY